MPNLLNVFKVNPPSSSDAQMELVEHLAELRTRLFRSVLYLAVGMILTYNFFSPIFKFLMIPLESILALHEGVMAVNSVVSPFMIRMQVCLIAGLTVAFPLIVLELWGFIAPALTPEEAKPVKYLAPFSALLFLAGAGTAYACLPTTYQWMASYLDDIPFGTLYQDPQQYMLLTVKLLLAFGVSFQLPLILLFLAKIGIITSELMTKYWRHATVIISVAAAIITPSNDPVTMLMMGIPMGGLYILSISLVKVFEPREDGTSRANFASMFLVSMVPVVILGIVGLYLWRSKAFVSTDVKPTKTQLKDLRKQQETDKASLEEKIDKILKNQEEQAEEIRHLREEVDALKQSKGEATPTEEPAPIPTMHPMLEPKGDANPSEPLVGGH